MALPVAKAMAPVANGTAATPMSSGVPQRPAGTKPSALADYLAEHGITARTWAFLPEEGALGERLLGEAEAAGADMLVMGAYGHSRLREMVLGGVTQSVTAKAKIPVFMAH